MGRSHPLFIVSLAPFALSCGAEVAGGAAEEATARDGPAGVEVPTDDAADVECALPEARCETSKCSTGNNEWGRLLGGDREDFASGIAVDSGGNALVVGTFARSIDFCGVTVEPASHYRGAYVVKFDPTGRHLWSNPFGELGGPSLASAVAIDGSSDHVLVTGNVPVAVEARETDPPRTSLPRSIFVSKMTPDGAELWREYFPSSGSASGQAVAADADGNVFVTGFKSEASSAGDYSTPFLAKLGPDGSALWELSMGATEGTFGRDLAVDSHGDVVWIGSAVGDPVTLTIGETPVGPGRVFVAKVHGDGSLAWVTPLVVDVELSCDCFTRGHAISVDSHDRIIVVGESEAPPDGHHTAVPQEAFVKQLSSEGVPLWGARWTGSVAAVAVNARDEIAMTGSFFGDTNLGGERLDALGFSDVFVARIDDTGRHLWSTAFGTYALESGAGVAFAPSGALFVVGHVGDHHAGEGNTVDFGSGPLITVDQTDAFVTKYSD